MLALWSGCCFEFGTSLGLPEADGPAGRFGLDRECWLPVYPAPSEPLQMLSAFWVPLGWVPPSEVLLAAFEIPDGAYLVGSSPW